MKTFQDRLRGELTRKNMRPSELARKVGVSATAMNNYLSGDTDSGNIRVKNLLAMAESLGCDPFWLLLGTGKRDSSPSLNWKEAEIAGLPFEFTMPDDSMSPDIQPGDKLTVNPSIEVTGDEFVAIELGGQLAARKLKKIATASFLELTNQAYPEKFRYIELDNSMKIIGKITSLSRPL